MAELPVERLWGVGPATAKRLHEMGLKTALDIRMRTPEFMFESMGKFGHFLHELSFGRDTRPVSNDRVAKSRGSETTFYEDVLEMADLKNTISELAQEVATSLGKMDLPGRTVVLKVKYDDFTSITRSHTLNHYTKDAKEITQTATDLLAHTEAGRRPIRLLGVSVSNLQNEEGEEPGDQLALPL